LAAFFGFEAVALVALIGLGAAAAFFTLAGLVVADFAGVTSTDSLTGKFVISLSGLDMVDLQNDLNFI